MIYKDIVILCRFRLCDNIMLIDPHRQVKMADIMSLNSLFFRILFLFTVPLLPAGALPAD